MKLENCWMLLSGHRVAFGDLTVEGGRIAAIDTRPPAEADAHRARRLIMPGLVNCHGHTPMTLVRGLGGGLPLQRWLEEAIFPVEAKMRPADIAAGMTWGAMEMLAGGTTAVADMYDFPLEGGLALAATGMKGRICRVGLSFVPGRLDDAVRFTRDWNEKVGPSARVQADVCIHSEYLTDEKFCREMAAANRDLRRRVHLHFSETQKEHDECLKRHGKTPIAYLASTGLLDFGGYAAHGVYATDDDFRIMREKNVSLVHNPTSNLKLGSGIARIPAAVRMGVNVALGTDGVASNDNLDMFEEMHLASLIHKGLAKDPTVLSPWQIIDMATKNAAAAIGLERTGEIKVGYAADLCVVNLAKPHLVPAIDLPSLVVHSMHASDVEMTIVDGEILYERGKWMKIDCEKAEHDLRSAVKRLGL